MTFTGENEMNWREHITVDPAICHGKDCIKGTRVMAGGENGDRSSS